MIPNYQIEILKREMKKAMLANDNSLFNALSNTIRVLENHKCECNLTKETNVKKDGFKDERGETQGEKYGF